MKIILDLTIITRKDKITGIERVALESVKNLLKKNYNHTYFILCSKNGKNFVENELDNFTYCVNKIYSSPFKNRILTDQIWLPILINKVNPDYVYYTTLGIPLINQFPFTMIIHDAVAWALPGSISKGMNFYYKPLLQHAIKSKKLDKIMTVSYFSKSEIEKYLKVPSSKIFVNYLGISDTFVNFSFNKSISIKVLQKYNINSKYIISLGTLEPRKNLNNLLKSFLILKTKYNYQGKLVLVGRKGWIGEFYVDEKIKNDLIVTGFVSEEDLPYLIKLSEVYVFPSYYEGFGLPLIEAMSLGVPVISSNRTSLPEIGGDACTYFNPSDCSSIAQVILQVLNDKDKKKNMKKKSIERAKLFTWEKHADKLLKILGDTE